MKTLLLTLTVLISSITCNAGDSKWTVCNSKSFLMSAFEHRSTDGKSRQTDITLVYGGHVAKGVLLENSQKISLGSNELKLDGELTLNYKTNRMTLDGPMYIDAQRFDIEEVLRCVDKTQTTSPGSSGH